MNSTQFTDCQNCAFLLKKLELFDLLKQKCSRADEIAATLVKLRHALDKAHKLLQLKQARLNEAKVRLKESEKTDQQLKIALVRIVSCNAQVQEFQEKLTHEQSNHVLTVKEKELVEGKLQAITDENLSLKLINQQLEEKSLEDQKKASDDLLKSKKILKANKVKLRQLNTQHECLQKKHDRLISSLLNVASEETVSADSLKKIKKILSTLKSKDEAAKLEAELNTPTLTPDGTTSSDAGVFSGDESPCTPLSNASLRDDLDLSSDDEFEDVADRVENTQNKPEPSTSIPNDISKPGCQDLTSIFTHSNLHFPVKTSSNPDCSASICDNTPIAQCDLPVHPSQPRLEVLQSISSPTFGSGVSLDCNGMQACSSRTDSDLTGTTQEEVTPVMEDTVDYTDSLPDLSSVCERLEATTEGAETSKVSIHSNIPDENEVSSIVEDDEENLLEVHSEGSVPELHTIVKSSTDNSSSDNISEPPSSVTDAVGFSDAFDYVDSLPDLSSVCKSPKATTKGAETSKVSIHSNIPDENEVPSIVEDDVENLLEVQSEGSVPELHTIVKSSTDNSSSDNISEPPPSVTDAVGSSDAFDYVDSLPDLSSVCKSPKATTKGAEASKVGINSKIPDENEVSFNVEDDVENLLQAHSEGSIPELYTIAKSSSDNTSSDNTSEPPSSVKDAARFSDAIDYVDSLPDLSSACKSAEVTSKGAETSKVSINSKIPDETEVASIVEDDIENLLQAQSEGSVPELHTIVKSSSDNSSSDNTSEPSSSVKDAADFLDYIDEETLLKTSCLKEVVSENQDDVLNEDKSRFCDTLESTSIRSSPCFDPTNIENSRNVASECTGKPEEVCNIVTHLSSLENVSIEQHSSVQHFAVEEIQPVSESVLIQDLHKSLQEEATAKESTEPCGEYLRPLTPTMELESSISGSPSNASHYEGSLSKFPSEKAELDLESMLQEWITPSLISPLSDDLEDFNDASCETHMLKEKTEPDIQSPSDCRNCDLKEIHSKREMKDTASSPEKKFCTESATSPLKLDIREVGVNTERLTLSSPLAKFSMQSEDQCDSYCPLPLDSNGIILNSSVINSANLKSVGKPTELSGISTLESNFSTPSEILHHVIKILKISPNDSRQLILNDLIVDEMRLAIQMVLRKNNQLSHDTIETGLTNVVSDVNQKFCSDDYCKFAELCNKQHFELHKLAKSTGCGRKLASVSKILNSKKPKRLEHEQKRKTKVFMSNQKEVNKPQECEEILEVQHSDAFLQAGERRPSMSMETECDLLSGDSTELCGTEQQALDSSSPGVPELMNHETEAQNSIEPCDEFNCDITSDQQEVTGTADLESQEMYQNPVPSEDCKAMEKEPCADNLRRSNRIKLRKEVAVVKDSAKCAVNKKSTADTDNAQSFSHKLPVQPIPTRCSLQTKSKSLTVDQTRRKRISTSEDSTNPLSVPLRCSPRKKKVRLSEELDETFHLQQDLGRTSALLEGHLPFVDSNRSNVATESGGNAAVPTDHGSILLKCQNQAKETICSNANVDVLHKESEDTVKSRLGFELENNRQLSTSVVEMKDSGIENSTENTTVSSSDACYVAQDPSEPSVSMPDGKKQLGTKDSKPSSSPRRNTVRINKKSKLEKLRSRVSRVHPLAQPVISISMDHESNHVQPNLKQVRGCTSVPCKTNDSNSETSSKTHAEHQEKLRAIALQKLRDKGSTPINAAASGRTTKIIDVKFSSKMKRSAKGPRCESGSHIKVHQPEKKMPLIRPEDRCSLLQAKAQNSSEQDTMKKNVHAELQPKVGEDGDVLLPVPSPVSPPVSIQEKRDTPYFLTSNNSSPIIISGKPMDYIISQVRENSSNSSLPTYGIHNTEKVVKETLKTFLAAPSFTPEILQKAIDALSIEDLPYLTLVIIRDVVGCVEDDYDTPLTFVVNRNSRAPILTPVQQQLVTLVLQLSFQREQFRSLPNGILRLVEYRLFRLGKSPEADRMLWLARFYAAICRALLLRPRALIFCWDILYSFKYAAYPVILAVLKVWPSLIPQHINFDEACPNTQVMLHILLTQGPVKQLNKNHSETTLAAEVLKKMFATSSPRRSLNSQILLSELSSSLIHGSMNITPLAVVLLAKKEGEKWALDHVINSSLLPALELWRKGELTDAAAEGVIWAFCAVSRPLTLDGSLSIINTSLKLFISDLLAEPNSVSPHMQEVIAVGLTLLSRHDLEKVAFSLLSWKPDHARSKGLSSFLIDHLTALVKNCARDVGWWCKASKKCGSHMVE